MNPQKQHPLLSELLSGEELSDFRQASLERGIASIRRQHHRRTVLHGAGVVSLCLLLIAGVLFYYFSRQFPFYCSVPVPHQSAMSAQSGHDSHMKFINDDELFNLFPGRSMALIGKPGEQQLVFLDGPPSSFRN